MAISTTAHASEQQISVSTNAILTLYAVTPLVWLVIILDTEFFSGAHIYSLPRVPEQLYIFSVLFALPHIIASALTFFDLEYIRFYRKKLLLGFGLIASLLAMPLFGGEQLLAIIYAIWTVSHVVGQQFGLTLIMTYKKSRIYQMWRVLGITILILITIDVFVTSQIVSAHLQHFARLSVLLLIPFTVMTILYHKQVPTQKGIKMIWYNYFTIISLWLFYAMDLMFFLLFTARIIHDLCAFMFYIAHDHNRNLHRVHNIIYKPLVSIGIPIVIIVPLLCIVGSYYLNLLSNYKIVFVLTAALTMFHYYTDSFTWKGSSIHRKVISFS